MKGSFRRHSRRWPTWVKQEEMKEIVRVSYSRITKFVHRCRDAGAVLVGGRALRSAICGPDTRWTIPIQEDPLSRIGFDETFFRSEIRSHASPNSEICRSL